MIVLDSYDLFGDYILSYIIGNIIENDKNKNNTDSINKKINKINNFKNNNYNKFINNFINNLDSFNNFRNCRNGGNYDKKVNIIEIGIGYNIKTGLFLNKYDNLNLTVLDINKEAINYCKSKGLNGYVEDIRSPKYPLYDKTHLIYSIRPPRDLQNDILNICKNYNIPMIIKPLSNETPLECLKLSNYKGLAIYLWEPNKNKK